MYYRFLFDVYLFYSLQILKNSCFQEKIYCASTQEQALSCILAKGLIIANIYPTQLN
jgi:hypothetical protein